MSAAVAAHAERHSKGNAYNFVADAEHAASFDLVTNQLKEGELEGGGTMCFRGAADEALGCVEGAFNWFASVCVLGEHLAGISEVLLNALAQYTRAGPSAAASRSGAPRSATSSATRTAPGLPPTTTCTTRTSCGS